MLYAAAFNTYRTNMEFSLQVPWNSTISLSYELTEDEKKAVLAVTPEQWQNYELKFVELRKLEEKALETGALMEAYGDNNADVQRIRHGPIHKLLSELSYRIMAEVVERYVFDKQAKVIDVGAGDGNLCAELKKLGFTNIHGVEPAWGIVNSLPSPNLYGKMYIEAISADKPTTIPNDTYDCAVLSGAVCRGHIECEAFPELVRILKPGGLIIFNVGDFWLKDHEFGVRLDAMLQSGLEDGTFVSVLKERTPYVYNIEDCNLYTVKISSKT